ncbi:MAG TPA: DegV family protein [Anaerolineaceae bacterium]|nr:DegV family protein [Anaerolineaceae bacterium]
MQLVSDRGFDLAPEQMEGLTIHCVPLLITLDGKTYRSGVDIQPEEFYDMLDQTDSFPTTSQPSAGDFAELYRELAKTDAEIFSIHISSGLSGTINSARAGAQMVPEAKVTFFDTKTLSCPMGWQVQTAARAIRAGLPLERVVALVEQVRSSSEGIFTLPTLKYLIHGGRINHMQGLLASLLNIKPIISVEKVKGTYVNLSQEMTMRRALRRMAELVAKWYPHPGPMRIQLLHGKNPEAVEILREQIASLIECTFLPTTAVGPALGAHTGGGLVGMAFAQQAAYPELP